jgi:hypothetical protein
MKTFYKIFLIVLAVVLAILLVLNVSFFLSGSLETDPTPEQVEKGRIGYGAAIVSLAIAEGIVIGRIFRKKR